MIKDNQSIVSKRRVVQLSATFFIGIFLLGSCKKEESNIGDSLQTEGLNVVTTDTFTIFTYTDELDSMESDETSVNMLGYYNDPVFGSVDCGIATQVRLSSTNPSFAANIADVVVDSVILSLAYTSINWYGNLDDVTVEVYEVTNDMDRDDSTYYTFSTPQTNATNLVMVGEETYSPDPISTIDLANGDTSLAPHLRIRLDTTNLGYNLVNINGAGNMATDELFVDAFKGLYIKADGSSIAPSQGGVLYFALESTQSKLTLYFHEMGDTTLKEYDFDISSEAARYNKIDYDRTGTHVESVIADTTQGQETFYTQAGAAWAVIKLPYIMDLYKDSLGNEDRKIINKAQLILPVQDFQSDGFDPSSSLFLAKIVDATTSDFTLDYTSSSTVAGNIVFYDEDEKQYVVEMTREIQAILNGERENSGFRIYAPSFFASSVERTIFNGPDSPLKNKARLVITYTDY